MQRNTGRIAAWAALADVFAAASAPLDADFGGADAAQGWRQASNARQAGSGSPV